MGLTLETMIGNLWGTPTELPGSCFGPHTCRAGWVDVWPHTHKFRRIYIAGEEELTEEAHNVGVEVKG